MNGLSVWLGARAPHSTAVVLPEQVRDAAVVLALARLEIAVDLRDEAAAGRILAGLAAGDAGPGGLWLARQVTAAGLRVLAEAAARPPPAMP